jgi:MFS family permease
MSATCSFYLVVAAGLLYGTAAGQMTMLAPMLKQMALTPAAIALVLAAVPLGNIAGRLCAAWIVEKIGTRRALWMSCSAAAVGIGGLICILSLPVLLISIIAAFAATIRGVSYSVFNGAGICAVRAHAAAGQHVYAVGLFTATFMAANLWAPAIGELTLMQFGMATYLGCATVPMLLAALLAAFVRDSPSLSNIAPSHYITLLRDRRLWLPALIVWCSGLSYGFSASILPVLLLDAHVPVARYFTSFGAALLVNRIALLRVLQKLPPPAIAAYGLIASIGSTCILLVSFDATGAVISGILFGLGYLLHPATVEWTLRIYQNDTVRPIALLNIALGLGQVVSMEVGASLLFLGAPTLLTLLCLPLILTFAAVAVDLGATRGERNRDRIRRAALAATGRETTMLPALKPISGHLGWRRTTTSRP